MVFPLRRVFHDQEIVLPSQNDLYLGFQYIQFVQHYLGQAIRMNHMKDQFDEELKIFLLLQLIVKRLQQTLI